MLRSGKMGLRLGATSKTWRLDDYMEDDNVRESGHWTAATGSQVNKEREQNRQHARHPKHSHSTIPLSPEVKEEPRTGHEGEEQRPLFPHQQTSQTGANKGKGRVGATPALITPCTSVLSVILIPWIIIAVLVSVFDKTASVLDTQPSLLRSVLQSRDLAVAKSHTDSVCFALNRLPTGLALDDVDGGISFDEPRFAINDVTVKVSRGVQHVDLLGSLIGHRLSPAIKANTHTGNCSLVESIRPIAQAAQVQFRDTLDLFEQILSSYDTTVAILRASQSGVQQALNRADKELRGWHRIWAPEDKEAGPKRKRAFVEMQTWQGILSDAVQNLSSGREIVELKIGRYRRSSAEFDVLVESLDVMAMTQELTVSGCGTAEAGVVERQLKVTVSEASSDVQEMQGFEEYYNAI